MNSRMIALLAGVMMLGGLASANAGEAVTLTSSQMEAVTAAGVHKKDFDYDKKFTKHHHDKKWVKPHDGKKWVKWTNPKMMPKKMAHK